ncbi:hypothetical protein DEU38_12239 [Rhodococcus sp. AG1013]|nr:hypothetical protein DEU38_12239 [Rhodococcus sp. AG1013]
MGMTAVVLLAGCGSSGDNATTAAPQPTTPTTVPDLVEPTCLAGNLLGFSGLPQTAPPVPDPMPIPDDFAPVRVVTCVDDGDASVADDHTVSWVEERRGGDMTAIIAGYRLPSEPPDEQPCRIDQPTPPIVWLVNENGLGLRAPGLPTGECGAFKWDAITAIRALPLTERIVHRIPLSPTMEARFNGEPG